MTKKLIVLLLLVFLITGCEDKKCIESHEEEDICHMVTVIGGRTQVIPYPCRKTVCDEYD